MKDFNASPVVRPFRVDRRRVGGLGLALGMACAASAQVSEVQKDASLHLIGGKRILWIYEIRAGAQGMETYFSYVPLAQDQRRRFRLFNPKPLIGQLRAATSRDDRLHLFFGDGTHCKLQATSGMDVGEKSPEIALPHRGVPVALATDSASGTIYALVAPDVAADLPRGPAEDAKDANHPQEDSANSNANGGREGSETGVENSSEPASSDDDRVAEEAILTAAPYVLVRHEQGEWRRDRPAPFKDSDLPDELHLAVHDDRAWILLGDDDSSASPRLLESAAPNLPWREVSIPDAGPAPSWSSRSVAAFGADARGPVIVTHSKNGGEPPFELLRRDPTRDWISTPLTPFDPHEVVDGLPPFQSATLLEDEASLAFMGEDRLIYVTRCSLKDGKPVAAPMMVSVFQEIGRTSLREGLNLFLQFVLLPVVFLVALLRRRDSVSQPMRLRPGQTLAPLSNRFAAFLLDVAILSPVFVLTVYLFWGRSEPGPWNVMDTLPLLSDIPQTELYWVSLGMAGVFCLYATIAEAWMGATPGKRLIGLRVVKDEGRPCGFSGALTRNGLRIIDFFFPPGLLMMLITVNRQRIGDIVAKTAVVAIVPSETPSKEPEDSTEAPEKPSARSDASNANEDDSTPPHSP